MIRLLKKLIAWKLRWLAKLILKKYQPKIVGVTGSVGKTSTKEAIFTVLSSKFRVRKNIKNYNNELGVPLSIIGRKSGYKNPFAWLGIFFEAFGLIIFRQKSYPDILVLEMGADKPGDIKELVELAPCHIGVITALGQVHTELFGSLEKVIREKQNIISHLKVDNFAVLNQDDPLVMSLPEKTRAQVITFGYSEAASVRAVEADISSGPSADPWIEGKINGFSFKLAYKGATVPVFLPSVLGEHQVYSALAAAAVGFAFGLNAVEIIEALKKFQSPAGRMRLLPGIKHTSIIDDTYNSSPMAVKAALKTLQKIKVSGRKWAILGDMLELGVYTETGHREVGGQAVSCLDYLVTVGERSKFTAAEAKSGGLAEDHIYSFGETEPAGKFIQQRIKSGDILLIKGSQGSRMERIVKELMAEPEKAKFLLVRQGPEWLK